MLLFSIITILSLTGVKIRLVLANENKPKSNQLASGIGKFTNSLYQTIIPNATGNLILSPLSVQTALTLLLFGANGQTSKKLQNGLKLSGISKKMIATQFHSLLMPFQNTSSPVNIANAIYLMKGYKIQQKYISIVTKQFYSIIQSLNFADNIQSAQTINSWVSKETHGKITDLISPEALNSFTRLVLVNAIYFKGNWLHRFTSVYDGLFYSNGCNSDSTSATTTKMMHVTANFRYGNIAALNAQILELPYIESDLSMIIILPNDCSGLDALQNSLKSFDLNSIDNHLFSSKVIVTVPKFTIETSLTLNEPLSDMGMEIIFSNSADFSGILQNKQKLDVSQVVHKAYIDVNENGTVAAAATGIILRALAVEVEPPPIMFIANHPFIFLIKSQNSILFIGRFIAK